MKKLDCPQCGAAITDEKCPYCGAVFYDFSAITLNDPCYIKIRVRIGKKETVIRARVLPTEMDMSITPEYSVWEDYTGEKVTKLNHMTGDIKMRFALLQDMTSNELYTIEDVKQNDGY